NRSGVRRGAGSLDAPAGRSRLRGVGHRASRVVRASRGGGMSIRVHFTTPRQLEVYVRSPEYLAEEYGEDIDSAGLVITDDGNGEHWVMVVHDVGELNSFAEALTNAVRVY